MTAGPHAFRRYGPAVAMALLIPVLSLLPARFFKHVPAAPACPGMDKLVHALMYAALTAAFFHTLAPAARTRYSRAVALALAAALYGLVLEYSQKILTRSRSCDPLDALANLTGALACAVLFCAWFRRQTSRDDSAGFGSDRNADLP